MRIKVVYIIVSLLFGASCKTEVENTSVKKSGNTVQIDSNDVINETGQPIVISEETLNFIDSEGMKQGVWKKYTNGKLWKVENYKDDKLQGFQFEYWANGEINRTEYNNGSKHGYSLHYDPDSTFGNFVSFWENGQHVWSAFPWELESYIIPIKGFIISRDSAAIQVLYNSGKLMYEGTITTNHSKYDGAIGLHKAYYETGEIKAIVDYDKETISIFKRDGTLMEYATLEEWNFHKVNFD